MEGTTKAATREYVVLRRLNAAGGANLEHVGTIFATGAHRAIDDVRNGEGGRWVAVAISKWNEEDLEVVQREPTVKRTRVHPGQTEIELPA